MIAEACTTFACWPIEDQIGAVVIGALLYVGSGAFFMTLQVAACFVHIPAPHCTCARS